jgi:hypothetical protein
MAGGLFSRVKTWIKKETVLNTDLNAEFNNIIANLKPGSIDDYSLNLTQMQTLHNPGGVGTEVQPASLGEELGALRYMLKAITGEAHWYAAPDSSIATMKALIDQLTAVVPNQIRSGRVDANSQPMFLIPNGSAASVQLNCATTNLALTFRNSQVTFSANITLSGLSTAPSSNNTALVNDSTLAGTAMTKTIGEFGTDLTIDNIGSEISSLNGKVAGFKITHSAVDEYFIADVDTTNNRLRNCRRAYFFDSADAHIPAVAVSDNDVITLMKLAWVFVTYNSTTPGLDVTYNQPFVQKDTPSGSTGDYWYDTSSSEWKKYSGVSWVVQDALPAGIALTGTANTVAARSADFTKTYADTNTVVPKAISSTVVRSERLGERVSVYGTTHYFQDQFLKWTMAGDLDTGVEAASTNYFLYLTVAGDTVLSVTPPNDRHADLFGAYHPAKPWRCLGIVRNDASSNFTYATNAPGERAQKHLSVLLGSSGAHTTSGAAAVITNQTIEIPVNGRPIMLVPQWAGGVPALMASVSAAAADTTAARVSLFRDTVEIDARALGLLADGSTATYLQGAMPILVDANPGIGGRKYEVKASTGGDTFEAANLKYLVMELPL